MKIVSSVWSETVEEQELEFNEDLVDELNKNVVTYFNFEPITLEELKEIFADYNEESRCYEGDTVQLGDIIWDYLVDKLKEDKVEKKLKYYNIIERATQIEE